MLCRRSFFHIDGSALQRSGCTAPLYFRQFRPELHFGIVEIIRLLHAQPDTGAISTELSNFQGHDWRDAFLLAQDKLRGLAGCVDCSSERGNAQAELRQYIFTEYCPRMSGLSVHHTFLSINGSLLNRGVWHRCHSSQKSFDNFRLPIQRIVSGFLSVRET